MSGIIELSITSKQMIPASTGVVDITGQLHSSLLRSIVRLKFPVVTASEACGSQALANPPIHLSDPSNELEV